MTNNVSLHIVSYEVSIVWVLSYGIVRVNWVQIWGYNHIRRRSNSWVQDTILAVLLDLQKYASVISTEVCSSS